MKIIKVSSVLVTRYSFGDIMSDKKVVQYIFDYFISKQIDGEMCIDFLFQIPEYSSIDKEWFFDTLVAFIAKKIAILGLSPLMLIVYFLIGQKNETMLTNFLGKLIASLEFWNNGSVQLMKDFIKSLLSIGIKKQIDCDLFYRLVSPTLFVILATEKYGSIASNVCELMKTVIISVNNLSIAEEIGKHALSFGMLKSGSNTPIYKYTLENMMLNFAEESEVQGILVETCLALEEARKMCIFSQEDIVYLSYVLPAKVAKKLFISFMLNASNKVFIQENISIIVFVFQKYAHDEEMRDCLASFAVGSSCTLKSPKMIVNQYSVSIYVKMFMVVAKGKDVILLSHVVYLFQGYLLIEPGFAFFFELISGRETILNEADVPLTAVDQEAVVDDARLSLYQRWLQKAQENDQELSSTYVSSVTDFILSFVGCVITNDDYLALTLKSITLFANKSILSIFIKRFSGLIWR